MWNKSKRIETTKVFCKNIKIDFLCTPFDLESLNILINITLNRLKLAHAT